MVVPQLGSSFTSSGLERERGGPREGERRGKGPRRTHFHEESEPFSAPASFLPPPSPLSPLPTHSPLCPLRPLRSNFSLPLPVASIDFFVYSSSSSSLSALSDSIRYDIIDLM